jgi:hypothetical protein
MANPFPFSVGAVLTAAQMNGIGESVAFTPTWTNLTVGNGTQSFRYVRVNNLVYVSGKITLGSTSSVTGNAYFTTPVTSTNQADVSVVGSNYLADAGVGNLIGTVIYSANSLFMNAVRADSTYTFNAAFSATVPFVWSVGDYIAMSAVYTV